MIGVKGRKTKRGKFKARERNRSRGEEGKIMKPEEGIPGAREGKRMWGDKKGSGSKEKGKKARGRKGYSVKGKRKMKGRRGKGRQSTECKERDK